MMRRAVATRWTESDGSGARRSGRGMRSHFEPRRDEDETQGLQVPEQLPTE